MARYTLPPRQKMINLLYILLIAMMAINTTSDAQKEERKRHEKELEQLAKTNEELNQQLQQERIAHRNDSETVQAKEENDSIGTLLINDTPIELTANGQLETPIVMVASSSANLLYRNYRNPLAVTTIGIKASALHLEMENGTVRRSDKGWTALPDADASEVKLIASYQKTGNTLPIGKFHFRVKEIPSPTSYLKDTKGVVYQGNVPMRRSQLLVAKEVAASTTEPEIEFKVVSFETILIKENGKQISTIHTEGNQLTLEQKGLIGQWEEGDAFYITSIIVEGPDGQKRQSNPINVIIIR